MRHYNIFLIIIFFQTIFFFSFVKAAIQNSIIVKVGDEIVTSYELESKIKTTLLINGVEFNQTNINRVKNNSLRSLINTKLKYSEVKKFNLELNQTAINIHLKKISLQLGVETKDLQNLFYTNGISYDQYLEEIQTEFLWQKLIMEIYSERISVDEQQIMIKLTELKKQDRNIEEFHLAEIEVDLENSNSKDKIINEIKTSISKDGFKNTAIKYSVSSTGIDGGLLGWVSLKSLSKEIFNIIENMQPGQVSEPIIKLNKIVFLRLLDRRKIDSQKKLNLENLKESLINEKKRELLNLYSNNHLSKKRNTTLIERQ